jgi:hypothetical protein
MSGSGGGSSAAPGAVLHSGAVSAAARATADAATMATQTLNEAELARPVAVLLSETDTLTLLDIPGKRSQGPGIGLGYSPG